MKTPRILMLSNTARLTGRKSVIPEMPAVGLTAFGPQPTLR